MDGQQESASGAGEPALGGAVSLTARAVAAVRERAGDAGVSGFLLRVAAVAGGCNGLSYELYFIEAAAPGDRVFESDGVRIAVDPTSFPLLEGTVIDLPGSRAAAFRFDNPRARKTCSCGASFEV